MLGMVRVVKEDGISCSQNEDLMIKHKTFIPLTIQDTVVLRSQQNVRPKKNYSPQDEGKTTDYLFMR